MEQKHNLTKILLCCAVALLILASASFCGMARGTNGGLSAFFLRRSPRYQDDWRLVLVNGDYALPKGFAPTLLTLSNGEQVDERIYPDLQRMFDDARAAGLSPFVRAGYRTAEAQERIMENRVDALLREGWPEKAARKEARRTVARPGCQRPHVRGRVAPVRMAVGKRLALRLHSALSAGSGGRHRHRLRAVALPLRGSRRRPGDPGNGRHVGGIPRRRLIHFFLRLK